MRHMVKGAGWGWGRSWLLFGAVVVALALTACGDGGEGGGPVSAEVPVNLGQPGPGDAGNYFPFTIGNRWQYQMTITEDGLPPQTFVNTETITGTRQVGGVTTTVFADSNPDGSGVPEEFFLVKDLNGIAEFSDPNATDPLSAQLPPLWDIRFPLAVGTSFVQVDRKGLNAGDDLDGDGINERVDIRSEVAVDGFETVTVPVGTFADCARLVRSLTLTIILSGDGRRVTANDEVNAWFAPGVGRVKETSSFTLTLGNFSETTTETAEMIGFAVDGRTQAISIVASADAALSPGAVLSLSATALNPAGTPVAVIPFTWASSNPAVASVDASGRVLGGTPGSATITASLGDIVSNPVTIIVGSQLPSRQIAIATNDLIFDPFTLKIYASVPSRAGVNGNSVAIINPESGQVESFIPVGSEPKKLALSDDGRFLYVALDGTGSVARLDFNNPAAPVLDLTFPLGNDSFFGPFVEDMEVMPGARQTVAISRMFKNSSPRHGGVAIFDDGVQRATTTPGHTGSNVIEFSALPGILYGYNNETTEFGFRRMAVDAAGVTELTVDSSFTSNLISGFNVDIEFADGLIYATSGRIIDPDARTLSGTIAGIDFGAQIEPDPNSGRIFFLSLTSQGRLPWTIRAFNTQTLAPSGSEALPTFSGSPLNLIRWGNNGLAFGTTGDQVVLVRTNLIP